MLDLRDPTLLRDRLFVGGEWREADEGGRFEVLDPSTGAAITSISDATRSDATAAIEAASAAWPAWRALTAKRRASILGDLHRLILEHADDLARIVTAEMGKPLREAKGEVLSGADYVQWYAEEAKRAYGEVIPTHAASMRLVVIKQPVGVSAAITPWNFPFSTIARKVAPALAAGCPVVVKPAEDTPLAGLALAELAARAGIPPGIFNVVTALDPVEVGHELTTHPLVRKVSFTGSTEVGRLLMRQSADTVKKISFELGGNAPFIVFDDADLDLAIAGTMVSKYRNGGQTCICANRVFVQDTIVDEFAERLAAAARSLSVGPGTDDATDIGPLINHDALAKVIRLVDDAVDRGARVHTGGRPHALGGTFYEPTVLTDVRGEWAIANEEIFGPVATLFPFHDESDVIRQANDTPYGLAAYLYTKDNGRVWRVGEALEYGMVGINTGVFMTEVAPFGGIKQSGIGHEGGHEGLAEYLESKYLAIGID